MVYDPLLEQLPVLRLVRIGQGGWWRWGCSTLGASAGESSPSSLCCASHFCFLLMSETADTLGPDFFLTDPGFGKSWWTSCNPLQTSSLSKIPVGLAPCRLPRSGKSPWLPRLCREVDEFFRFFHHHNPQWFSQRQRPEL